MRRRNLVIVAAAATACVLLLVLVSVLAPSLLQTPYWDGGKWRGTEALSSSYKISYETPRPVIFKERLFLFYSIESKSTYKGGDVITPDQYSIEELAYRTFDGGKWSGEALLTSAADNSSNSLVDAVVLDGTFYVVYMESWKSDLKKYEWNSTGRMKTYDGSAWTEAAPPFTTDELPDRHGKVHAFAWASRIWVVWKVDAYAEYNKFAYKTYYNGTWGPPQNFTFPSPSASNERFSVIDDRLWVVWEDWSRRNDQDIYLAAFDGGNWTDVTVMTPGADNAVDFRPQAVMFKGQLFVGWETEHWESTTGGFHACLRGYGNGHPGPMMRVSTDNRNGNYEIDLCPFRDKLYVMWHNVNHDAHHMIRSYDGNGWSTTYEVSDMLHPAADYPRLFVYKDTLWAYWLGPVNGGYKIMLRGYG